MQTCESLKKRVSVEILNPNVFCRQVLVLTHLPAKFQVSRSKHFPSHLVYMKFHLNPISNYEVVLKTRQCQTMGDYMLLSSGSIITQQKHCTNSNTNLGLESFLQCSSFTRLQCMPPLIEYCNNTLSLRGHSIFLPLQPYRKQNSMVSNMVVSKSRVTAILNLS